MRIERTITTISWIPSEAFTGATKLGTRMRIAHYDVPPPDDIGGPGDGVLEELRANDGFRFANRLQAWIEVEDGRIVDHGYSGGGEIGATTLNLGVGAITVAAVSLPDRQLPAEVGDGWVRFTQTAGGRTGVPAPRPVPRPPFVQYLAPIAWTTVQLEIRADGTSHGQLVGASNFPRHWVYGDDGKLAAKSGLTDFKDWLRHAFGKETPWGELDSPALVTQVESALERELSTTVMRDGAKPDIKKLKAGKVLVEQGDPGQDLFVLLDGVLTVEVDGEVLAEIGPGAVLGERAVLEGGRPHLHAARGDGVPRRGRPPRPDRHRAAGHPGRLPPQGRADTGLNAGPSVRRPRLDPRGGAGVRRRRRPHLVRRHRPRRRRAADPRAGRRHRAAPAVRAARR